MRLSPDQLFGERLARAVQSSVPCVVGLDPHLARLPRPMRERFEHLGGRARREAAAEQVLLWAAGVLDEVAGLVPMIKPQIALYEQLGSPGLAALEQICEMGRERGLLVLVDAKRGDIGSTAEGYARALLDDDGPLAADAVTLAPYMGRDSIQPFLRRCDEQGKGLFVLVRTSNPGGGDLQPQGEPSPAMRVASWLADWNRQRLGPSGYGPVGAVVGATVPEEARQLRLAMPGAWVLVPGYGAQGGTLADTLPCFDASGLGAVVNSSRGVTFAAPQDQDAYDSDFRSVVRRQARAFVDDMKKNGPKIHV